MTLGKGDRWLRSYRSLAERLRPHIVELVPVCVRTLGARPEEDQIARNLVDKLTKRGEVRKFARVEYHYEPFRSDGHGNWVSTGQIDFVAHPPGDSTRDAYLAFECKCLNVTTNQGKRSRARRYIVDGVSRYFEEKYSEDLPLACMLGYVVDGAFGVASAKVRTLLQSRAVAIGLVRTSKEMVCHHSFI